MQRITLSCLVASVVCLCAMSAEAVLPATEDVVMYEVNLRAFSQAGNLAGVTARLDNIQELGANVIWLMPIHPIGVPNRVPPLGSPYSVQNYHMVSSEYGTLSDLTTLINAAHDRGMSVIMDWVANHTAWDHPWITANPSWYTQNAQGQIVSPNSSWLDVADLNYNNVAMRAAMVSEMQYWVADVGIDGFRCDAADLVPNSFWQQAIPAVRGAADRPLLMYAEGASTNHYNSGFDLTFGWDIFNSVKNVFNSSASATTLKTTYNSEYSQVPAGKSIVQFTTNHDENAFEGTPIQQFGSLDASLAAFAATIAYGGVPLIYDGQEIGWDLSIPFFSKAPLNWNTGQATADWYATILGIHNNHTALRRGTLSDQSNSDVAMLLREHEGDQVLMLINTRNHASQIAVPLDWRGEWIDELSGESQMLAEMHTLTPYEVLLLTAVPASLFGDYNENGVVDAADYTVWRDALGVVGASLPNDFTPDILDASDYTFWKAHFGEKPGSGSLGSIQGAVPEPATGVMFTLGMLALGATGVHRHRRAQAATKN